LVILYVVKRHGEQALYLQHFDEFQCGNHLRFTSVLFALLSHYLLVTTLNAKISATHEFKKIKVYFEPTALEFTYLLNADFNLTSRRAFCKKDFCPIGSRNSDLEWCKNAETESDPRNSVQSVCQHSLSNASLEQEQGWMQHD